MLLSLFYGKWFRSYVEKKVDNPMVYLSKFYGISKLLLVKLRLIILCGVAYNDNKCRFYRYLF